MITHFADVTLPTPSIAGVKQFYGRLGFKVLEQTKERISFRIQSFSRLTFELSFEPLAPAHLAFEVPMSAFDQVVAELQSRLGPPLVWPDGDTVKSFDSGCNVYYRDGDGHLLEWIAHGYVNEHVFEPEGPLRHLYLREVGLPVEDVRVAAAWLQNRLNFALFQLSDDFAFARGGTAHSVVVSTQRRWIPIEMVALPPRVKVVWGAADLDFIGTISASFEQTGTPHRWNADCTRLEFEYAAYLLAIEFTPTFTAEAINDLNLPE